MPYKVFYTKNARDDLRKVELRVAQRILKKIAFFVQSGNPLQFAERLRDSRLGTYRFRSGDYRAIFDLDKQYSATVLMILRIKHRKDVYDLSK